MRLERLTAGVRNARTTEEVCDILDDQLFEKYSERRDEQHSDTGIRQYSKLKADIRGLVCDLVGKNHA